MTLKPSDSRKPYEPPKLVVLGSARDLTQAGFHGEHSDGAFPHPKSG